MEEPISTQLQQMKTDGGLAEVSEMEQQGDSTGLHCPTCGRPLDLRCEDCGCPVSCHDWITPSPKSAARVPYCAWDGPCWKERSPLFLAAVEHWQREASRLGRRMSSPDQAGEGEKGQK